MEAASEAIMKTGPKLANSKSNDLQSVNQQPGTTHRAAWWERIPVLREMVLATYITFWLDVDGRKAAARRRKLERQCRSNERGA
jgi:hypothetical protein